MNTRPSGLAGGRITGLATTWAAAALPGQLALQPVLGAAPRTGCSASCPGSAAAAHVVANPVMRPPANPEGLVFIDAEPAASVLDVGNAIYAFTLRALGILYSPVALLD